MRKIKFFTCFAIVMLSTNCFAEDMTPAAIFENVIEAYKVMDTYQAQGEIISNIITTDTNLDTKTSFSIALKKPNAYLVTWSQDNAYMPSGAQVGAVWNDGTQPYLYMGANNQYSKIDNDEAALASATGISGGAALTIPSLFFLQVMDMKNPFSRFNNPQIEGMENIGGDECYVISGSSSVSKKETFWISKTNYLIKKYSHSLELSEEGSPFPEMTDEQIEEALATMGTDVTPESVANMREMMENAAKMMETSNLTGDITETHVTISFPELNESDFQFTPPEGAVLTDSLFSGIF